MRYILFLFLFFSFSANAQKNIKPTESFVIQGEVNHELTVTINDLAAYKKQDIGDVNIKNHKGEAKAGMKDVKGVLLKILLDSAGLKLDSPKDYSSVFYVLKATDGYTNIYSWNELFNNDLGNHVFVITNKDGAPIAASADRIQVLSVSDDNTGRRSLKSLEKIEVHVAR